MSVYNFSLWFISQDLHQNLKNNEQKDVVNTEVWTLWVPWKFNMTTFGRQLLCTRPIALILRQKNEIYFLIDISSGHHTKKTEKQFASSPGRKSATQQSLPLLYDDESDVAYTEADYYTEAQQDFIPEPAMTPTRSVGKKKKKAAKAAPSPSEIKTRPKRSAAAMKSPLKSDIYVDEIEDIEELSDSKQEQSESAAATATEPGPKETPVKYTEIIPVTGPVPVVPKLETEDSFQTQEYDEGSAAHSGAIGEQSNLDNIVKKEAELDIEAGTIMDEEDPDWEPGTKKRRKSSGSGSVTSPVNVSGGQAQSKWISSLLVLKYQLLKQYIIYWALLVIVYL